MAGRAAGNLRTALARSRIARLTAILAVAWAVFAGLALGGASLVPGAFAQVSLPPAVSEQGEDIRILFFVLLGIGVAVFIIVEAMILWVVFRYRRKSADEFPTQVAHNNLAEFLWTAIPLVIVVALFFGSLAVLEDIQSAADEGEEYVEVDVLGRQWAWAFNYATPLGATLSESLSNNPEEDQIRISDPSLVVNFTTLKMGVEHMRVIAREGDVITVQRAVNGTVPISHRRGEAILRVFNGTETIPENRLQAAEDTPVVTVPVGTTIRFNIASVDVLHAFYTPQFLYKLDAVPGRVQTMWVNVTEAGEYASQCAEFCGRDHSRMIFTVRALPRAGYDAWLAEATPAAPEPVEGDFGGEEEAPVEEGAVGNPVNGQRLFFELTCNICHGDHGQGVVGPTIAQTVVPYERVVQQYREPLDEMQTFTPEQVSDEEIADIYAWLQTQPRPPEDEVKPSKLAELIEAGG